MTDYLTLADAESSHVYTDMLDATYIRPDNSTFRQAAPFAGEYAKRFGSALAAHFLQGGASVAIQGSSATSFCCWFNADALASTQHISRVDFVTGGAAAWRIVTNSSGNLEVGARSQSGDALQSITAFSAGTAGNWHFLYCGFDWAGDAIETKLDNGSVNSTGVTFGASTLTGNITAIGVGKRPADNVELLVGAVYGFSLFTGLLNNTVLESLRTATSGLPVTAGGPTGAIRQFRGLQ